MIFWSLFLHFWFASFTVRRYFQNLKTLVFVWIGALYNSCLSHQQYDQKPKSPAGHKWWNTALVSIFWIFDKWKDLWTALECHRNVPRNTSKPWYNMQAITQMHTITRTNQETGGLSRQWKAHIKVKLHGLTLPTQKSL